MRDVAELLERKRTLLDRRHEAGPECLADVERELQEIDEALSRLETKEARRLQSPFARGTSRAGNGVRNRAWSSAAK